MPVLTKIKVWWQSSAAFISYTRMATDNEKS